MGLVVHSLVVVVTLGAVRTLLCLRLLHRTRSADEERNAKENQEEPLPPVAVAYRLILLLLL